jgi:hypothetical protein
MKSLKETEKKIVDLEVFMKNDMSSQNNKIDLCENKCKILQMEVEETTRVRDSIILA